LKMEQRTRCASVWEVEAMWTRVRQDIGRRRPRGRAVLWRDLRKERFDKRSHSHGKSVDPLSMPCANRSPTVDYEQDDCWARIHEIETQWHCVKSSLGLQVPKQDSATPRAIATAFNGKLDSSIGRLSRPQQNDSGSECQTQRLPLRHFDSSENVDDDSPYPERFASTRPPVHDLSLHHPHSSSIRTQ
jgi:hypothetical protein